MEEMRSQLNTLIQHNKHNTSTAENTAQHQPDVNTQTQSISTAEETQRLQHIISSTQSTSTERNSTNTTQQGQNIGTQTKSISSTTTTQTLNSQDNRRKKSSVRQSNPLTTTSPNSANREEIVILCDSNGHHLHQRRLFPGRTVKKVWCPTSRSALNLLREDPPTHIILHTGTNDLTGRRTDITEALSEVLKTACRIYPSARVIFSTLLPRRDIPQNIINQINREIAGVCAQLQNVSIANHQRISHDHLYDHIHFHRDDMRLFAKTLKEATLRSPHETHCVHEEIVRQTVSYITADLGQIKHMLKLICDNFLH
ncbi:hypothetical protein IRJ41_012957 [Triplophysa rosa]|uniref:Uncharacterized protein n=1 Tax=Triplophysa rosa TaxID=992332 RepID=A0A9W7TRF5_TRIRA|nr:hypothetical protein IRJ41_012957 [Triplophysa rosa]